MADDRDPAGTMRNWFASVRMRTTVAAVAVVAVALAIGGFALVTATRTILLDEIEAAARLRAREIGADLASGTTPALAVVEDDEQFVQILTADGDVRAASANVAGLAAVADVEPGETARVEVVVDPDDDETEELLAVAVAVDAGGEELVVLVGRAVEDVFESTAIVTRLLVVGLPLLLLVVAGTTWGVIGRALRPVEEMRREVDEISASELHRRVRPGSGDDEIARLARTMNRMLDRLAGAQARQRRFVADASHELRSPIASIRQHAEVAAAHPDRVEVEELARTAIDEATRMQALVDDLLLLTRADEHTLHLERRPVDLDDLVFEEAARLRSAPRAGSDAEPHAQPDVEIDVRAVSGGRVDGDAAALRSIVRNLGDNALRHAGSRVAFALTEDDRAVSLVVDDDGPGIPAPERERVLERFVRLDDARSRDGGGAGLGLAIVAELVAAHGATLRIGERPGGGARVEVRFPPTATGIPSVG